MISTCDVVVIGAGPAGACAAAMLARQGVNVWVFEKEQFPRFSIGESLLPQSMTSLAQAGLLDAVNAYGFQPKHGATFAQGDQYSDFAFCDKFSPGPADTYQVKRQTFDLILADGAAEAGAKIFYRHQIEAMVCEGDFNQVTVRDLQTQQCFQVNCQFVLDASGFGRVLPRLCDLEQPSQFPARQAIFGHFNDNIGAEHKFNREHILICVHPTIGDIWFWLIPFSDGTSSIGVVARIEQFAAVEQLPFAAQLDHFIQQAPQLSGLLSKATPCNEARQIKGYSANVSRLYGDRFALLGNAGEFLDPVFSSGVTIALQSAVMAVPLVLKALNQQAVDWETEFSQPLRQGIDTFKAFVEAWYNGDLRTIIFYPNPEANIKKMVCSVLAGYAWDTNNPLVKHSQRRIKALAVSCAQ